MIQLTDTLEQLTPLTNAERLDRYRSATERSEVSNEYRRRHQHGARYKRALNNGHPASVTGIPEPLPDTAQTVPAWAERADAPRDNVINIQRETA